jgi:hypothetical protein
VDVAPFAGPTHDLSDETPDAALYRARRRALPRLDVLSSWWHRMAVGFAVVVVALLAGLFAILGSLYGTDNGHPTTYQHVLTGIGIAIIVLVPLVVGFGSVALWRRPALRIDRWGVVVYDRNRTFVPWEEVDRLEHVPHEGRWGGRRDLLTVVRRDGSAVPVPHASLVPPPRPLPQAVLPPGAWFGGPVAATSHFDRMCVYRHGRRWRIAVSAGERCLVGRLADYACAEDAFADAVAVMRRCNLVAGGTWQAAGADVWCVPLWADDRPDAEPSQPGRPA